MAIGGVSMFFHLSSFAHTHDSFCFMGYLCTPFVRFVWFSPLFFQPGKGISFFVFKADDLRLALFENAL